MMPGKRREHRLSFDAWALSKVLEPTARDIGVIDGPEIRLISYRFD
jgi:hypothetical protein